MGLDYPSVVRNVVFGNISHPYMARLVEDNFRSFVTRSLLQYAGNGMRETGMPETGVVGSIGYFGRDILVRVAAEYGITVSKILRSPVDGLADYYECRYGNEW